MKLLSVAFMDGFQLLYNLLCWNTIFLENPEIQDFSNPNNRQSNSREIYNNYY